MELLSEHLTGGHFLERLKQDLKEASLIRFLVGYVSTRGIEDIGRNRLIKALEHEKSFGVSSLSCICGYAPLYVLQEAIDENRLKYFMDPKMKKIKGENADPDLVLLHSKLVYLHLPDSGISVVYIGSHNWTSRALSPSGLKNAEATLRLQLPFDNDHLDGKGTSIAAQVNRHLIAAYQLPACLEASNAHALAFEQWEQIACGRSPNRNIEECVVVSAVLPDEFNPANFENIGKHGIYLRTERHGEILYEAGRNVLVLIWESKTSLENGFPPVLLRCTCSSKIPAPSASVRDAENLNHPKSLSILRGAMVINQFSSPGFRTSLASTSRMASLDKVTPER